MKIKNIILPPVLLIIAIYIVAVFSVQGVKVDIGGYKGEGVIKTVGTGFVARGFEVEFNKFNLQKPFKGKFLVDSLPVMKGDYILYLRTYKKYGSDQPNLSQAVVKFSGRGFDNSKIFEVKAKISDWYRTSLTDGATTDYYYSFQEKSSRFNVNDLHLQPIYLDVEYQPGEDMRKSVESYGSLVLRSGGSK